MNIPDNCRYTETHEWVRLDGDLVFIGISDYAQGELGDVVYVELPEIDTHLAAGEECGMIDSAKTTSPLLNPVAGSVARINEELADHPELVNKSPYDEGWMYAVTPDDPSDLEGLMDAEGYLKHVEESEH